jgi:hypothetical protein
MDEKDIRFLNTINFMLLARQKGVKVMRTTMAELERLSDQPEPIQLP